MAILTTGPVTLEDIYVEFASPVIVPFPPITLHDYCRGGGLVPDTPQNAGVPTSPPITIDDLRGASAYTYTPMTGSLPDIDRTAFANRSTGLWAGGVVGTSTANVDGGGDNKTHTFSVSNSGWDVSGSGATATVSSTVSRLPGTHTTTLTDVITDGEGDPLTLTSTVTLTVQGSIGP